MPKKILQCVLLSICFSTSSFIFAAVKEYTLVIDEAMVNLTGKSVKKITVNGQFPAPSLEFIEGDEAVVYVQNNLKNQDSSIHWHGLLLPGIMDGVPGFNQFNPIPPKGHFEYRFKIRQSGTYWYHAHSRGQEQDGLYGSFIIHPKNQNELPQHEIVDRDYVIMLSDFHETSGEQIMKNLKKSAEYYQNQRETIFDVLNQTKRDGIVSTWKDRAMWNQMRMLKTDLSDVTGYTFLVNGKTPEQNWTGAFKPNEKIRLRFINASAMSFFDVRIPNLKLTVVSADGQPVQPIDVDEFRIGAAETYDVIVTPTAHHYQIQAESIDRSGFALATLQHEAMQNIPVQIPDARPRALLTMDDMGHHMGGDQHSHDSQTSSKDHEYHTMSGKKVVESVNDGMNHPEMNHSSMNHSDMDHREMAHVDGSHQAGVNHDSDTSHSAHIDHSSHVDHQDDAKVGKNQLAEVYGWANASTPADHKALQYSDLKSLTPQVDRRAPQREIKIQLGGVMERYIWTMDGKKFNEANPINVAYGERVRLTFVNESMMAHPMHLHGMFMQLENGQSIENLPNKHTVIVPPGKSVSLLLTADELGEWAIHCHLLYHMSAGMMNKLVVANVSPDTAQDNDQNTSAETQHEGHQHAHH